MKQVPFFVSVLSAALTAGSARAELAATFESGGAKDTRADRLPALYVKAGESPTPFLPGGEFSVTWTGKLVLAERQRLSFSFEGEGKATLTIDGEEVHTEDGTLGATASKSTRFNKGEHDITIVYRSKADGSGRFRLFWEERAFPKQSVPPTVFKTEAMEEDLARKGRLLFAENHCSKCHMGAAGMTELTEFGPMLLASGSRLNEQWIAEWLANPSAFRHDTRMPDLIDESTPAGKQQAADLAAWLMTQKVGEAPPAPDKALAQKGGEHFHRLGCVACHTPAGSEGDPNRVPLSNVAFKFQPGALSGFLKKPDAWYAHIGMPDFALSDAEADQIAAFLLDESSKTERKPSTFPKGDPAKGMEIATALNCGSCHAGTGAMNVTLPTTDAIFKKDWAAAGCVSATPGPKAPRLALDDADRAALVAFSKKGMAPLTRHVPSEYAASKVKALHCTSCHGMDGHASLLDTRHVETKSLVAHVAGENEKLDQSRPHLTYIGEMLHSSYIEGMLTGKPTGGRPRPWLDMRMPGYTSYATGLADGLARLHGVVPGKAEPVQIDAALAEIGKKIASSEGFGCTTCHGVGPVKPSAAFEVEGVNFALSHERLRKEWYIRWMDNPTSVTPGSKMPRYSDEGKSQRPELDGDANKQFEAIWNYIQKP
ncbi:c-type cytochrome [Luteolibacter flavescens]|uniref:C-type cytochrome n=1 Tax=Luteolibacter flavescens TaxID=1859460 RepID=A0ABT3FPT7_9BACT|nr:c-type cytochrome [Luteolibacter flavescens]MCW1885586.1 c-type cytochrome [Luteolibacter flavescens]